MNDQQRAQLKTAVEEKIRGLRKDVEVFRALSQPVSPDNAIGRLTRMEAINAKSINEAALAKARLTLARLERVLPRIDHPDFGLCRECEEPIPFARLLILPETDLCVSCAEEMGG
jgi:DnaK suppressor protein